MAAILGTPVADLKHGNNYTPETSVTGTRFVIYGLTYEDASTGVNRAAVSLGGNAMTQAVHLEASGTPGQSGSIMYCDFWYLPEASIPVGSSAISITGESGDTGIMFTVDVSPGATISATYTDKDVEGVQMTASIPVLIGDVVIAIAGDIFTGRTFTWGGITERMDGGAGGFGDWVYSAADHTAGAGSTLSVTCDSSGGDATAGIGMAAIVISESTASPSVDTVDNPVTVGSNAHTVSDFSTTINAGRIYSGTAEINFTSANDTAATIPAIVDTGNAVPFGTVAYELTDGTFTEEAATTYAPPAGYAYAELTSGFITDSTSYLNGWGGTPAVGDQMMYPSANLTLNDDGTMSGLAGQYTCYAIDVSDTQPTYEEFIVTLEEGLSVTADATVNVGSSFSFSVAGFLNTITGAKLISGTGEVVLTGVSNTSASIPAVANTDDAIPFGTVTLEVTDGTDTATTTTTLAPAAGATVTTLSSSFISDANSFMANYAGAGAAVQGDQFYNANAALTLNPNGTFSGTAGSYTVYAIDVGDAQPTYEGFTVTVSSGVPSLDTQDATMRPGSISQHTVSDFGSTINAATMTVGTASIAATLANDTQATWPAVVNGGNAIPFGPAVFEVDDGTDQDSASVTWGAPSGFGLVTLASGFSSTGFLASYPGFPESADQFLYPLGIQLFSDGTIAGDVGDYVCYGIDVSQTQPTYIQWTVTIAESTGEVSTAITPPSAYSNNLAITKGSHDGLTPLVITCGMEFNRTMIVLSNLDQGLAKISAVPIGGRDNFYNDAIGETINLVDKHMVIIEPWRIKTLKIEVSALTNFDYFIIHEKA